MQFSEYEREALKTKRQPSSDVPEPIVPLLGLAGEAGELLSEYKKWLRDGNAHRLAKERIAEELGDLLWYLTDAAHVFGINLEDIAAANLMKVRQRWDKGSSPAATHFDDSFPDQERFPRTFDVRFESIIEVGMLKSAMFIGDTPVGAALTDNAYGNTGYRYHDVFHLSCVAVLGWSPVIRALLKRKRKSIPKIDEVEDGGRAVVIEEGISALVFSYAERHNFLEGVGTLDFSLLRTIIGMTDGLEVSACTPHDWEMTIMDCYEVWRQLQKRRQGTVHVDLDTRSIVLMA